MLSGRHDALRKAQTEAAQKGWDVSPIKIERMIHEVYQAVKDKSWVLTAANHRSFNEVVWNFPGAGAYLGTDGGGGEAGAQGADGAASPARCGAGGAGETRAAYHASAPPRRRRRLRGRRCKRARGCHAGGVR